MEIARLIVLGASIGMVSFACHAVGGIEERSLIASEPDSGGAIAASDAGEGTSVPSGTIETFAEGVWARNMVVDDRFVYVADVKLGVGDSRVLRYEKEVGAKPTVVLDRDDLQSGFLRDMFLSSTALYWYADADPQTVRRRVTDGGAIEEVKLPARPLGIATSTSSSFMAMLAPADGGTLYDFAFWSEPNGPAIRLPDPKAREVIFHGEDVYYFSLDKRIGRWRPGEATATTIGTYSGNVPSYAVAIVGDDLFFMNASLGAVSPTTLSRVPLAGGTPSRILTDQDALQLAADGPYLYLLGRGFYVQNVLRGARVLRCEATRCKETLTELARDIVELGWVGFDEGWVYWTEGGVGPTDPGRVRRFKK